MSEYEMPRDAAAKINTEHLDGWTKEYAEWRIRFDARFGGVDGPPDPVTDNGTPYKTFAVAIERSANDGRPLTVDVRELTRAFETYFDGERIAHIGKTLVWRLRPTLNNDPDRVRIRARFAFE